MMDRLAALADILPPLPPAPLPPAPWWQAPQLWLGLAVVLAVCVGMGLAWMRGRAWRRLRAQARAAQGGVLPASQTAVQLAAQLRVFWPEADWPPSLRVDFDRLRFAHESAETASLLHATAQRLEFAATPALRAAWLSRTRAQTAFERGLRNASAQR
ncbi:hypothetical protein [Thiomonas sp.]